MQLQASAIYIVMLHAPRPRFADCFGLGMLNLQANRWNTSMKSPEVQRFTRAAQNYVLNFENKIVLIDGERLANLMIAFGVGLSTAGTYEVKRIESTCFEGG